MIIGSGGERADRGSEFGNESKLGTVRGSGLIIVDYFFVVGEI